MNSPATPRVATDRSACLLSCPDNAETRAAVEEFAVSACDEARRYGWKAWARWTDDGLNLWLEAATSEERDRFLTALSEAAPRYGARLAMLADAPPPPIYDVERAPIPWGTVIHARLTRELLCALPEGAYVASDSTCSECASSLGRVGPFSVRAQQWQRAQLAGLDGSMCRVLWSHDDFVAVCGQQPQAAGSAWV